MMPTGRFIALDVETANADLASICQIGVHQFADGGIEDSWTSLVNPEDEFDPINVSIHGIDEAAVRDAPRFVDIAPKLAAFLTNQVVATHMAFDRVAVSRACGAHGMPVIDCRWLDTARVARRTWPQFSRRGFGLADLAAYCELEFRHHDALEDARVAGEVLLRAIAATGLDIDQWLIRTEQPIDPQGSKPTRSGNPDGELFGEVVVFTGALSMPRREAADLAAHAGCEVMGSVGKSTTLLVVGDQDIRVLAGQEKSSKHRKAEDLIARGQVIRVLKESDFRRLIGPSLGGHSGAQSSERAPKRPAPRFPEQPQRRDIVIPTDPVVRNIMGIALEKEGFIDNAIECYKANAQEGFEGNHPYDRLAIIYRRRGDVDKELAVLRRAIEVFEGIQSSPRPDVGPKLAAFRQRYLATLAKASDRGTA
jgi:DNA polymerase-3 subunit epsilon